MANNEQIYNAFESMGARIVSGEQLEREGRVKFVVTNLDRELAKNDPELAEQIRQYEEFAERDRREAKFEQDYPNGFDRLSDEIATMKSYGLYCGTCGHGNGCEHGVPASRV